MSRLWPPRRTAAPESRRSPLSGLALLPLLVLLLAGCGAGQTDEAPAAAAAATTARYVGDEACASCHEDVYLSYHRTGMGRSVSRFDPETAPERFDGETVVYNAPFDYHYEAFVRGDTLFQREYRLNEAGELIHERVHRADWVIGSGHATRSYLMDVNGYLTEMPLTWYVERRKWDMSPGYTQKNQRFSRAINLECMTCHNGIPEQRAFTEHHYVDVPDGITCERCHGPGGDHVERRLAGLEPPEGAPDPAIINPARLDRDLQLSVCQQCHLTGTTVFKPGEDPTTFRPGRPLGAHRVVFVTEEQRDDPEHFGIASHAARLALSECFQESAMTCTTCHDPHQPTAELGRAHFNETCQSCHTPAADLPVCGREEAHTAAEAMSGDCVSCHMQQGGTSDIPHVTFTDHWIREELPPARDPDQIERVLVRTDPFELVRMEGVTEDPALAELEEAIAYFNFYETQHRLPAYLPLVVEKARRGLAGGADHVEARLALGRALAEMDSLTAAEKVLTQAAAHYPEHAVLRYWLGSVRLRAGRPADAVAPLQQATALQPAFVEAHLKLGEALQELGRTVEAERAYLAGLRRDSLHHASGWNDLGFLYLQSRRLGEAEAMFERAVALDPDLATAWVNAGTVRLLQEDFAGAAARFERALGADPNAVAALGNLAIAYMQLGRYAAARRHLERLLALQPGDARARALLSQLDAMPRKD